MRHQITDLLAGMSSSPLPSLELHGSICTLAYYDQIQPSSKFHFVDFMRQMLLAREATLRIQQAERRWFGGITARVLYDMAAADLWARSMEIPDKPDQGYTVSPGVLRRQLDGIVKFADEMQWPHANEVRKTVDQLRKAKISDLKVDVRVHDWICGLILPGASFPLVLLGVLYRLSPTLQANLPTMTVKLRLSNYGIVYAKASYWNSRSVLGKVLAPLVLSSSPERPQIRSLGGWVGPCPSPSLPDCLYGVAVSISGHSPPSVDVQGREAAQTAPSAMLGIPDQSADWILPTPPAPSTETATFHTIRLSKKPKTEANANDAESYTARLDFRLLRSRSFVTFTLYTNSVFVAAPPCQGIHRVDPQATRKYTFAVRGIEELAQVSKKGDSSTNMAILVVNATGGPSSEVFARAWCCHTGTNAVIWKLKGGNSCFKCGLMVASTDGIGSGVLIAI
ncbi:hypothetical protein N7462_003509 [Penicillium macrosclerotiorum]|uniref:uncharacterized protein n=1 Tax=Penicillium macrosclerotiorum TaxID=303699 RepID=UPI0025478076|nr:uncharacterized protein N7462_003509 [Penicillium macrosclerotiorum]KAJ5689117.1 hypothetical protein N7462_003509 [Penicillium macrosclerotiorum]